MNSLVNYGSDDDLDDSPDEKSMDSYGPPGKNYKKPATSQQPDDTNYDEVQMSLSEDSDDESKSPSRYGRDRDDTKRGSPKYKDFSKDRREDRSDKERYNGREERSRYRDEDRSKNRDSRSRDDDRNRDRYRERDEDRKDDRRAKSRESYSSRDDRSRQDRDRRRSRSPRDSRDRRRSRSPRRSRSRSRERIGRGGFQRRFDRRNKFNQNDPKSNQLVTEQGNDPQNKDRFFMPGITGRFRDQIEKRKLLWQKKGEETSTASTTAPEPLPNAPKATKVWEGTTFAQDTDGKVANKFKRLMGIKTPNDGNKAASEVLKKQDEMFSAMEQQYEVARTTTHTMRGVGLGFGSYNR
ncbi:uncharacterized protein ZC262.2-like isoform X1 [Diorhabda sublineata]|uniref:uncharacterized protein ZC262.2-like isoform X1 n=1 Tax=Diorhabda sublineata TaxID=1163346 RepID=UPI0024E18738|nr:uncharacterized protein ZC262.2-like isoform X1 [Diorhabda sublineata]